MVNHRMEALSRMAWHNLIVKHTYKKRCEQTGTDTKQISAHTRYIQPTLRSTSAVVSFILRLYTVQ